MQGLLIRVLLYIHNTDCPLSKVCEILYMNKAKSSTRFLQRGRVDLCATGKEATEMMT
jgi:hypothetical protein